MKKLLLLFTLLTAAAGFAKADEIAFVAEGATYTGTPNTTVIKNGNGNIIGSTFTYDGVCSFYVEKKNINSNSQVNTNLVRWYQNDIMHITPAEGVILTKITFNCSTVGYAAGINYNGEALEADTKTPTWTGETSSELQFTASKQVRFSSIEITYTKTMVDPVEPTTVTFTPEGGTYSAAQTVTLEADGNDANGKAWPIYYTVDGTEPTAESTLYTEPITVDESMTVKAIAVGATTTTDVAVAEYVINLPAPSAPVISANGMVIPNESEGYEIEMGTVITIVSENATSIVITPEDGEAVTVEGSEATYTITASGLYIFEGVNSKGSADAMIEFVVTVPSGTDVLTCVNFNAVSSYAEKAYNATVNYSGYVNAAANSSNSAFSLRPTTMSSDKITQGGGIVVTKSSSYAHSITFTQYSGQGTTTTRSVKLYGSNEPYSSPQLNVSENFSGTELAEVALVKGEAVKYTFTENYKYIAIQPVSGACQFSEIAIEWGEMLAVEEPVAPAAPVIKEMVNGSIDAAVGETVTISGEEGSIVYVKETRQDEPEIAPYAVDVDGWMTDNADTYVYTIPEYPAIVEAKSVRQNVESPVTVFNVGDGKISTGIESVAADSDNAEAEYFNLQGIRVDNPQGGVFIRRQGAKVAKVAL